MLSPFFNPKGIAVVGASRDPHKLGYGVLRNLKEYHYRGNIYPVNRVAREILGYSCYRSVAEVPDPVDLAVIVVPAPAVVQMVQACGKRGIKYGIVVSGGFGETDEEGKKREVALKAAAQEYGMRLIGPNCIGTIDTHTPVNTTFVVGMPRSGDIGFVSQSGALVAAVIDWARGAGVGFSRMVSLGNEIDVTETEMLEALAEDPATAVVTAYIEGVKNGRQFLKVAEKTARNKPVVILKAGRGKHSAKAVASHTGALAGSRQAYDAAFDHSGILRANTTEELFDWARALAWQPLPKGKRVAILTNAGGPAIIAVDFLDASGLELAPLTPETKNYLRSRLPAAASVNNPVDVLAGSGPGSYAVALDALLSDSTVDAALVIQAPQDWFLPASLAEVIGEVAAVHRKPVMASVMGLASVDQALAILHSRRVPNFSFPERAVTALAVMNARRQWLETPAEKVPQFSDINKEQAAAALRQKNFQELLRAYGISLPPEKTAGSVGEAVTTARKIGFPVAAKLVSADLTHKTEVGGVKLNLEDESAVRSAYDEITAAARAASPDARIEGILIQKMLPNALEMIVGIKRDPQFGPVLLVGSGGTEVELIEDVAMGIAPLTRPRAEKTLDTTLAAVRLRGWRGKPAGDREAVINVMLRLSQLAADFPEITELEINPLMVLPGGQGAFAVDVRGFLEEGSSS